MTSSTPSALDCLETLWALVREDGNDPNTVAALTELSRRLRDAEQMLDITQGVLLRLMPKDLDVPGSGQHGC